MRRSGRILRQVMEFIEPLVQPGATTMDLEKATLRKLREMGAKAAFKGLYDYPCALCTSVNEEVVHGIPSEKRELKPGDIVSIDFGVLHDGYYSDSALTLPVGEVGEEAKRLIEVTERSLYAGIEQARLGNTLGDIGAAVQEVAESAGFSVVREFVGHGVGTRLHEEPQIPNYGRHGHGTKLREGMVLAIEPMVNAGVAGVKVLQDKWTAVTADGRLSAHFEHTVAVTKDGPVILTA
jgi:methionyl aminopeptidase